MKTRKITNFIFAACVFFGATTISAKTGNKGFMVLKECHNNLVHHPEHQNFKLTWHLNIKHSKKDVCLQQNVQLRDCHYLGGNQL